MIQQPLAWVYVQKDENSNSKRHMNLNFHSSTIYNTWKQPKCPQTDEWIKMWCARTHTHTRKYYLTTEKNEILSF